jgi:hypothetical protein
MKPSSIVYWMRFFLAIVAGYFNHFLGITDANFGALAFPVAVGFAVVFYVASVIVVKNILHFGDAELKGKNRTITLGGGTFIMVWVMVSVLLNTLKL